MLSGIFGSALGIGSFIAIVCIVVLLCVALWAWFVPLLKRLKSGFFFKSGVKKLKDPTGRKLNKIFDFHFEKNKSDVVECVAVSKSGVLVISKNEFAGELSFSKEEGLLHKGADKTEFVTNFVKVAEKRVKKLQQALSSFGLVQVNAICVVPNTATINFESQMMVCKLRDLSCVVNQFSKSNFTEKEQEKIFAFLCRATQKNSNTIKIN